MAQSELAQLQDRRDNLRRDLEKLDADIVALKNKRKEELLAELKELGLDVPRVSAASSSGEGGKKKGRPKGTPMSEAHKQALREGRARATAARDGKPQPELQEA